MYKGIIIYLSIFVGAVMLMGGSYITINNLIEPSGLLFEGIVGTALGVILLMIIVIANSVGKAFMMFGEILEQTTELNRKVLKASRPTFPGLFSNPSISSIQVTDLDSGETSSTKIDSDNISDSINIINNMIKNVVGSNNQEKDDTPFNKDSSKEKLEKKLAEAINKEDFETAAKINAILSARNNSGNNSKDDSENK